MVCGMKQGKLAHGSTSWLAIVIILLEEGNSISVCCVGEELEFFKNMFWFWTMFL